MLSRNNDDAAAAAVAVEGGGWKKAKKSSRALRNDERKTRGFGRIVMKREEHAGIYIGPLNKCTQFFSGSR